MIDRETVQKIKDAADIVEVVSDYVSLTRRGANYMGLCPFHNEKTPSFSVSPKRNFCYCFSCHKGGSPVNFIMEKEGISYHDALLQLAKKYNIRVEEKELTDEERQRISERESMIVASEWAMNFFHKNLYETQEGRDVGLSYLYSRGLTDETIKQYKLGYSTDAFQSLADAARKSGFDIEVFKKIGLVGTANNGKEFDKFRGRVMFPIRNTSGKPIAFGGRDLKGGPAKYINSPETLLYKKSNELYGIFEAKSEISRRDKVYLMEGYLDVISSWQSGLKNAVASSGTALTDGQIALLHRFSDNVTLIYDGDPAGIKASLRGIDMLLSHKMHVKVVLLPDGDDPDSFAKKHTAESFLEYIEENEKDIIEFKTDILMQSAADSTQEKARAIMSIIDSIACIPNDVERTLYIQKCSRMMKVDEKTVMTSVQRKRREIVQKLTRERIKEREYPLRERQTDDGSTQGAGTNNQASVSNGEDNHHRVIKIEEQEGRNLTSRGSEDAILKIEKELLKYCVRYGFVQFGEVEDERLFHIIDYINEELEADGITFSHEPYRRIFEILHTIKEDFKVHYDREAEEIERQIREKREAAYQKIAVEGMSTDRIRKEEQKLETELDAFRNKELKKISIHYSGTILTSHEEDEVRRIATEMLLEPHQLSSIYFREGQTVLLEEDRLEEMVPRKLSELRAEVLNLRIKEVQRQIKEASDREDLEGLKELMVRFQKLLGMRSKISGDIGDRILSPR